MALAGVGIQTPEANFRNVIYSEIHDAAVEAVINKMADVAAVGYSEYAHYINLEPSNRSKMRLLWLSPEIPYGPIMFNNRFASNVSTQLLSSFLQMHKESPIAFEAMKSGWSETKDATHFVQIDGSYYTNFKKILGSENEIQNVLRQVMK
jgi:phosphonate transport system substrate-binding protein